MNYDIDTPLDKSSKKIKREPDTTPGLEAQLDDSETTSPQAGGAKTGSGDTKEIIQNFYLAREVDPDFDDILREVVHENGTYDLPAIVSISTLNYEGVKLVSFYNNLGKALRDHGFLKDKDPKANHARTTQTTGTHSANASFNPDQDPKTDDAHTTETAETTSNMLALRRIRIRRLTMLIRSRLQRRIPQTSASMQVEIRRLTTYTR